MGLSGRRLPPGGTTGQALVKLSDNNGDYGWGPAGVLDPDAVEAAGRWEPVTTNPGGGPELVFDGDEILVHFVETP